MADNPKVFIAYSHDSPDHKRWVSELAAELRNNGVDAILDQWDLGPGDDVTLFMEQGIKDSDRVLVVCTDTYVNKANSGEGGVGYERMIVTTQLVQNLGTNKFIPIIRQASGQEKLPTCLGTRFYIDFMNDSHFDEEFTKLLHELHEVPIIEKPPLGKSPFPPVEIDTQLIDIPEHVESASEAYIASVKVASAGSVLGWRQLIKHVRPCIFTSLVRWRQNELDKQKPENIEQLVQVVDKAVEIVSPIMVVALAGVESGKEEFRDQKSLFDDLLNVPGWNSSGYTTGVGIPDALGYIYHSLHGSLSLNTNQLNLAFSLARTKVPNIGYTKESLYVWEKSSLIGWMDSIGSNCTEGWNYLSNAFERWDWLSLIFGNDSKEYKASLVAYYMALNIHELAKIISSGDQSRLSGSASFNSPFHFNVPLTFMTENQDIFQRAQTFLSRNSEAFTELWTILNVTHEQMQNSWKSWIHLFESWLGNVYKNTPMWDVYHYNIVHHKNFFEKLQP